MLGTNVERVDHLEVARSGRVAIEVGAAAAIGSALLMLGNPRRSERGRCLDFLVLRACLRGGNRRDELDLPHQGRRPGGEQKMPIVRRWWPMARMSPFYSHYRHRSVCGGVLSGARDRADGPGPSEGLGQLAAGGVSGLRPRRTHCCLRMSLIMGPNLRQAACEPGGKAHYDAPLIVTWWDADGRYWQGAVTTLAERPCFIAT